MHARSSLLCPCTPEAGRPTSSGSVVAHRYMHQEQSMIPFRKVLPVTCRLPLVVVAAFMVLCIQAEAGAVMFNHASPLRRNTSLDFRLHHEVAELASWWFSASRPKQELSSSIMHHHYAKTLPWTFAYIMRLPNLLHGGSLHPGRSRSCHLQPCLTTTPKPFRGLLLAS